MLLVAIHHFLHLLQEQFQLLEAVAEEEQGVLSTVVQEAEQNVKQDQVEAVILHHLVHHKEIQVEEQHYTQEQAVEVQAEQEEMQVQVLVQVVQVVQGLQLLLQEVH